MLAIDSRRRQKYSVGRVNLPTRFFDDNFVRAIFGQIFIFIGIRELRPFVLQGANRPNIFFHDVFGRVAIGVRIFLRGIFFGEMICGVDFADFIGCAFAGSLNRLICVGERRIARVG